MSNLVKYKKWIKVFALGLTAVVLVLGYSRFMMENESIKVQKPKKYSLSAVDEADIQALWMDKMSDSVDSAKTQSQQAFQEIREETKEKITTLERGQAELMGMLAIMTQKLDEKPAPAVVQPVNSGESGEMGELFVHQPPTELPSIVQPTIETELFPADPGIVSGEFTLSSVQAKSNHRKKFKNYLPAGTMIPAMISGGVHASTASRDGRENPDPIQFYVTGLARGPGDHKRDLTGCLVLGQAMARLSKERIDVRLKKISCPTKSSGDIFESDLIGHVYGGEDGVQGIRGKLYRGERDMIVNSFLAGSISGLSSSAGQALSTTSVSPLGQTRSVEGSDVFKAGLFGGASEGASHLQKYFVERAEESQPVIMISANREVTIILSEGLEIDVD